MFSLAPPTPKWARPQVIRERKKNAAAQQRLISTGLITPKARWPLLANELDSAGYQTRRSWFLDHNNEAVNDLLVSQQVCGSVCRSVHQF